MTIPASKVMELRNLTGAGMMDCKKALEEMEGDLEQAKDFLRKKGIAVAAKKSSRETTAGGIGIAFSDDRKTAAMVHLASETDFVSRNEKFRSLLGGLTTHFRQNGDANVLEQNVSDNGGTVKDLITEAITTMGENLQLVEAIRVEAPGDGMVGGYVHSNSKIGVLVILNTSQAGDQGALEQLGRDLAMHVAASQVHAVRAEDIDPAVLEKEREIFSAQAKESGKPDEIVAKMVEGRIRKFIKEVALMDQPFVKDPDKTIAEVVKGVGTDVSVERYVKFQF